VDGGYGIEDRGGVDGQDRAMCEMMLKRVFYLRTYIYSICSSSRRWWYDWWRRNL